MKVADETAQSDAPTSEADEFADVKKQWGLSDNVEGEDEILASFLPHGTDVAELLAPSKTELEKAALAFQASRARLTEEEINEVNQIVWASLNFKITIH